ncbi:hypothetical protein M5K25_026164 [Dendrobium thyrsiflorum]|uniref:Uncharacterized protein n=1 Tax=Dendrobium thyrsiflorum TaxID=117978 RepID=A0ABD0TWY3_DENTH
MWGRGLTAMNASTIYIQKETPLTEKYINMPTTLDESSMKISSSCNTLPDQWHKESSNVDCHCQQKDVEKSLGMMEQPAFQQGHEQNSENYVVQQTINLSGGRLTRGARVAEEARERENLHSHQAPVVASDQNVITSDPTGRESRRRIEVEQPRRSRSSDARNLYTSCEATKPNSNDEMKR